MIKSFEDLEIYQLSILLAKDIYRLVKEFPGKEKYIIVDQLMRASTSIGANIAEGFGRHTTKEFIKFLYNSRGSLMEVRHFLNLSKDFQYISNEDFEKITQSCNILGVKINNLISKLSLKL